MNAARSLGGILGLGVAWMGRPGAGAGMFFLIVLVSFGASLFGLGLAPHLVGFAGVIAVLVVVNAAGGVTDLLAHGLMQLSVPTALRDGPAAPGSWRSGARRSGSFRSARSRRCSA